MSEPQFFKHCGAVVILWRTRVRSLVVTAEAAEALIACDKLGIPNASASAIANYSIYRNAGKSVG